MTSNLISISENRNIEMADNLMKINRIRHLPVVNSDNELSGIISVKDIAKAKDRQKIIKSVMSTPARIVKKTDSVKLAIELMLKHKICSILVTSEKDIVGIVTTDDLLRLLAMVIGEEEILKKNDMTASFFDESWSRPN